MGSKRAESACPFPVALSGFVLVILASAALMTTVRGFLSVWMPLTASALATAFFGVLVETRRRKPNACPWLDFGLPRRTALYLLLFVVGIAVVLPGVWPSSSVEWVFRVPFLLLAIAGSALLWIHKTVDHGEFEEAGVPRVIYLASRLPVFLLAGLVCLAAVATLLAMVRLGS